MEWYSVFLGDISKFVKKEGRDWDGDELVVEVVHGHVKLEYGDGSTLDSSLEEGEAGRTKQPFVKRLFGFA